MDDMWDLLGGIAASSRRSQDPSRHKPGCRWISGEMFVSYGMYYDPTCARCLGFIKREDRKVVAQRGE